MDLNTYLLLLILSLGFLIRLPYRDFPIDEDYGLFSYLAHFRHRGVKFIKDFWGVIFPLLPYVNIGIYKICKGSVKNERLFYSAYNALTTLSIYYLVTYLNGSGTGLLAALLYALFSSAPHLGSYSINGEKYYLLPITLSAHLMLVGIETQTNLMMVLSGIIVGIAFLIKPVVIVSLGTFAFYIAIYAGLTKAFLFVGGILAVTLAHFLLVIYIFRKDLGDLWIQNKLRLVECLNIIGSYMEIFERFIVDFIPMLKETLFLWIAVIPFIFFAVIERTPSQVLIMFWIVSTFITLAGQRAFWQYQYQPVIHVFSIASAIFLVNYFEQFEKNNLMSGLLFGILLLSLVYSLLNLFCYFISGKDKKWFYNTFRKMEQYLYLPEVGKYIQNNSSERDYIYVWGAFTNLYLLSSRQSCEKSVFQFIRPYRKEMEFQYDETIKGIIEKKPKFIVQIFSSFNIEFLNKLTGLTYIVDRVFYNRYMVYRLSETNNGDEKLYKENEPWEAKKEELEKLSSGAREHAVFQYYLERGMDNNYVKEFEESLKINPYDVTSLVHLAIYYRSHQKYEKSFKYLDEALSIKKNRSWVHFERAMTYQNMEETDLMKKELKKAKTWLFPYNAGLWKLLGSIYRLNGYPKISLKWLKTLLKIHYPIESLYFEIGHSYMETSRLEEAKDYFHKELELYPRGEWKNFKLGETYKETGRSEKAIEYFHKELESYPRGEWKNFNLGDCHREAGRLEEAVEYFLKELEKYPCGEWKYFELGETYRIMRNFEKAIACYKKEVDMFSIKPYVHYQLASLLERKGKLDEALQHFKSVIHYSEKETNLAAGAYYHSATILMLKNKAEEAAAFFEKCINLAPDHKKAAEQLKLLEAMA